MYGMVQQEVWRQRPEEIRQQVAALRLEKALRADRRRGSGPGRDLGWEISRLAGLLGKHLRNAD
jgi:ribosomal protein L15E